MAFDFACPDWFERIQDGRLPIADLPLDERAATRAVAIYDALRLPDVPGQPTMAEAGGDWVRGIIRAIFGSSGMDGQRQVGEVLLLVPKKNAKTTNGAAIAIVFALVCQRRHADMLLIGPTQKISEVAFEQAKGIIEADPFLVKRFHVQDHLKTIRDRTTKSRLMIRTFGMDVLTGCKPVLTIIDELHILGSVAYAADVIRQIRGGMMPFPESLLLMITTQSDHPPAGVFASELQYARAVRDGRISDGARLLPVLYEFPEEMQTDPAQPWRDPAQWHLVTPNLGRSISIDRMVSGLNRAEADGAQEVIAWATQHLNVEVGLALHHNRWTGADFWMAAGDGSMDLERIMETSDVVTIGIDGGGLDDLLGMAVIGRHAGTKVWQGWTRAWAHPVVLKKRKDIASLLTGFAAQGDVVICETATQDIEEVAAICARMLQAGLLPREHAVGLDPYGVAALVDELALQGIDEPRTVAVGQGSRLSPAVWGLERKLLDGTFVHCGQPMMNWVMGNARVEQRGNAVLITKQVSGKAKIDPLVALLNAAMLMQRNPVAASRRSYLEEQAMVVL
jgi:phage terminase large subunit-like protein